MIRVFTHCGGMRRFRSGRVLRAVLPVFGGLIFAVFFSAGLARSVLAQTNEAKLPPVNRWLFVVETSKRLQPRAEAVQQVAASMLWSGMNGQMRSGDTVGLWTFNEAPHSGLFPLQVWTPRIRQSLAERVVEFLKAQKFEKASQLDKVLAPMQQVIRSSEFITVVLISGGHEPIQGTPFDDKINAVYSSWEKRQEDARIPFVTVLRAEGGRITHYAVATPPWPLDLSPLPAALSNAAAGLAASNPPPPPPMGLPLIVHGPKPVPPTPAQPSESVRSNAPPPESAIVQAPAAPGEPAQADGGAPQAVPATALKEKTPGRRSLWILAFTLATPAALALGIVVLRLRRARATPRLTVTIRQPDHLDKR